MKIINALKASESLKESEKNFDDTKRKKIFFMPTIEKIRKDLMNQDINFLNQK